MIIPIEPLYMDESDLIIGDDDYGAHISGAVFIPSTSSVTWSGAKPGATVTRQARATWTLNLDLGQDWQSAKSLSKYLFDHEGEVETITLTPSSGGQGFMADVTLSPGNIGTQINQFGTSTVALGVSGRPEYLDPPTGGE